MDTGASEDRGRVAREAEALRDAIAHIRNAKGVLDTFPETREYVGRVEKLADDYEKKLKVLDRQIEKWLAETRERARSGGL